MKKSISLILLVFVFTSCFHKPYVFNRSYTEPSGNKVLIGGIEEKALRELPFAEWYLPTFTAYNPDENVIRKFRKDLNRCRIEVFFSSWDENSQQMIPQFMKILSNAKFSEKRMTIYALNRYKKSFYGEEIGKEILLLPTIIFYKGTREIGRITGKPITGSWESDILMIVNEKDFSEYFEQNEIEIPEEIILDSEENNTIPEFDQEVTVDEEIIVGEKSF